MIAQCPELYLDSLFVNLNFLIELNTLLKAYIYFLPIYQHRYLHKCSLKHTIPIGSKSLRDCMKVKFIGSIFAWQEYFFLGWNSLPGSTLLKILLNHGVL